MQTHRAYMGVDTQITCWVRDESGKRDFDGQELTVYLDTYPATSGIQTLAASQASPGEDDEVNPVQFTVESEMAERYLMPGLYRFQVRADNEAVYSALLEMV
jgi:hypothetical protein